MYPNVLPELIIMCYQGYQDRMPPSYKEGMLNNIYSYILYRENIYPFLKLNKNHGGSAEYRIGGIWAR